MYLPPDNLHVPREALEEFCEKVPAVENPCEQAFATMVFIPYLQPFQDGNKRTLQLAMNIPLMKGSLAPFSFADIRAHPPAEQPAIYCVLADSMTRRRVQS
jgi:Fic family protein